MQKLRSLFIIVTIVILTTFNTGCDPLLSQDPKDFFANGKLPKQLEWIRSQLREFSQKEKEAIVARVEADSKRTDLLRVAIIDSGVDIAHPDLMSQIAYTVKDGRIVGAGVDIMGDGRFGSHVLIDPSLFALNAEKLVDKKIVNPPKSPLAYLKQVNDRFRELLLEGIKADPNLKDSLFARLQPEAFSVLGFDGIRTQEQVEDILERYGINKRDQKLITPQSSDQNPNSTAYENWSVKVAQNQWSMRTASHRPEALADIDQIEHADKFVELLQKTYDALQTEFKFSEKVDLLVKFKESMEERTPFDEAPANQKWKSAPDSLKTAMDYVLDGIDAYDPIKSIEKVFKSSLLYKDMDFETAFRAYYKRTAERLDETLNSEAVSEKTKRDLRKASKHLNLLRGLVDQLIALKNDPTEYAKMRSQLRRHIIRTKHPYIHEESNGNTHGTHVSGIVAKQDPNIRILPIRVTTQSVKHSLKRQAEIEKNLLNEFMQFTQQPFYAALRQQVLSEYGIKMSDSAVEFAVKKYLKSKPLDASFITDVINAVKAAGELQAKLANVSLGTTFEKKHSVEDSQAGKKRGVAEDIYSEFARYLIGKTIQEKASNTLFVVATGNDNGWVDGRSRTAFPVGITSPRLHQLSSKSGVPAPPNNIVQNILAVSSISNTGELTSFTNLMIDRKISQVFSVGESVMAPVPSKDASSAEDVTSEMLIKLKLLTNGITLAYDNVSSGDDAKEMRGTAERDLEMKLDGAIEPGVARIVHLKDPVDRKNLSGTSMATPNVTGLLAKFILKNMKAKGISSAEVYEHPDFKPAVLIDDALKLAKVSELSSIITVKMLTEGLQEWRKPRAVVRQKRTLKLMTAVRCESIYSY